MCEEFHIPPRAAVEELEHAPVGLIGDILELRAYARAKAVYDATEDERDLERSPMMDRVLENVREPIRRRLIAASQPATEG